MLPLLPTFSLFKPRLVLISSFPELFIDWMYWRVSPETKLEPEILTENHFWGSDSKKYWQESGWEREVKQANERCIIRKHLTMRHRGWNLLGNAGCQCQVRPHTAKQVYPPVPIHHWLSVTPRGSESLRVLACARLWKEDWWSVADVVSRTHRHVLEHWQPKGHVLGTIAYVTLPLQLPCPTPTNKNTAGTSVHCILVEFAFIIM